ncbi:hypothetical protein BKA61DRAFT_697432 [Leptodontidium sp. MPI-SDFR-AT-0119]|nr:hypothetical protein BKA61DRAFT_697432 [Leptodontidium sp. MPI-SDFR-AT-0119]
MVAIQSILSILAMTAIANALQSELVARGEVVSNYRFFNGKGCNFAESPSRRLSLQVGICYPEANFGSVAILSVSVAGCRWEQHTAGCTGKPIVTKSSSNPQCLNVNGTAPQNFYKFTCGN